MDFESYWHEHRKLIDDYLDKCLTLKQEPERELIEAMRYSVLAGGKRIRPLLVFMGGDLFF